ncbi:MAG: membrane protein insertion efficiency factor YidD [Phycisphaerae bacterium]|nr:membrane protein insertion efficiency factor YidD [Phycisphaerae bacterium]
MVQTTNCGRNYKVKSNPSLLAKVCIMFVKLYQVTLRPIMGGHCRFQPTCSDFAIEALLIHGGIKGGCKALYRILRCNPWGGCGYDPP